MDLITIGIGAAIVWNIYKKKKREAEQNNSNQASGSTSVGEHSKREGFHANTKYNSSPQSQVINTVADGGGPSDTDPERIPFELQKNKYYFKDGRKIFRSRDNIEYIVDYHKYWINDGQHNPNFDYASGKILDVKNNKDEAIDWFAQRIKEATKEGDIICVVPSSSGSSENYGIGKIAWILSRYKRINGSKCLIRYKAIEKLSRGGDRSIWVHLNSIGVKNSDLIKDKNVILIDDVTTTGNSMMACQKLLLDAGAKSVRCIALGKTVDEYQAGTF